MPSVPAIRTSQATAPVGVVARVLQAFGFVKAAPAGLSSPGSWGSGGWWSIIREPFTGAWQRNLEQSRETVLTYHAVYSCVTLIASDVSKCRLRLVERDKDGIWGEIESPAFKVLQKPNHYQNRIKFYEQWVISKLLHGNTYVLKQRDERKVVVAFYILDPTRVQVLIAPDGAVYYEISKDNLAGVESDKVAVPASEIIHDVMVPLYHPLCGVSPLTACGVAAVQGLNIQSSSSKFFANGSLPGGVLTAPNTINDETAERLKKHWEDKFSGDNAGKIAVLGDGLKFEQMAMKAIDAQLIEQLKWSGQVVCSTFHVPAYKAGVADPPPYQNAQAEEQRYYQQALQNHFESIELCLDEGLGIGIGNKVDGKTYGTEFDLDDLLRMDTATLYDAEVKVVRGTIKAPNEARKRLNLKPVKGGDSPLAQHQDYTLEALDKRNAKADPFATASTPPPVRSASDDDDNADNDNSPEALAAAATVAGWAMKAYFDTHAAQ